MSESPTSRLVVMPMVAVRTGATLVHRHRDFDLIAACLPDLQVRSLV
ncbi:MAG: hypothetical protein ACRDSL_01535 [Pseudonocardiaceae bacterium]